MPVLVAIVGSRTFSDQFLFDQTIKEEVKEWSKFDEIISGGATGADTMAAKYAIENSIPLVVYKPDWNKYGKKGWTNKKRRYNH